MSHSGGKESVWAHYWGGIFALYGSFSMVRIRQICQRTSTCSDVYQGSSAVNRPARGTCACLGLPGAGVYEAPKLSRKKTRPTQADDALPAAAWTVQSPTQIFQNP